MTIDPYIIARDKLSMFAIIEYMENTPEESWTVDVVRTIDNKNYFFGHLFNYANDESLEENNLICNLVWDMFEEVWATTNMIYPVNDGKNPNYPQPTPKQRVIAYLRDLYEGKATTTQGYYDMIDEELENRKN